MDEELDGQGLFEYRLNPHYDNFDDIEHVLRKGGTAIYQIVQ